MRRGTGILPVVHGRDAHATKGFARASIVKNQKVKEFPMAGIYKAYDIRGIYGRFD